MSKKSNRQLIQEEEHSVKLRKRDRELCQKKDDGQQPIKKMFKEDWRVIFEVLAESVESDISKPITQHSAAIIRKKIGLCEKVLPKFGNSTKYRNMIVIWRENIDF